MCPSGLFIFLDRSIHAVSAFLLYFLRISTFSPAVFVLISHVFTVNYIHKVCLCYGKTKQNIIMHNTNILAIYSLG